MGKNNSSEKDKKTQTDVSQKSVSNKLSRSVLNTTSSTSSSTSSTPSTSSRKSNKSSKKILNKEFYSIYDDMVIDEYEPKSLKNLFG